MTLLSAGTARPWAEQAVLVTGGAGFIGKHLVARLLGEGARVVVLDRRSTPVPTTAAQIAGDVTDVDLVTDILEREQVHTVFHLAAQAIMGAATRDPARTYQLNVGGTAAVAEAVRRSGGTARIVFTSSAAAYGARGDGTPLREDAACGRMSVYGGSKRAAEDMLRGYTDTYRITAVACRLMNTYGPGDTHLSRLVPYATDLLRRSAPFDLGTRDDGSTQLDFVYVADVVGALVRAGEVPLSPGCTETVNVGTGVAVGIRNIAQRLATEARISVQPLFSGAPGATPYVKLLDVTHALDLLGWKAETTVDEGLRKTWQACCPAR